MKRQGVPESATIAMFSTIQQLKHYVQTVHGDSQQYYSNREATSIYGVGQGNGAGPAIWAVVSSPLLDIRRQAGYGYKIIGGVSKQALHIVSFGYVDDFDLIQAAKSPSEVVTQLQSAIETWEQGLHTTGGILASNKTYWSLLSFQ
mmetsp:Transcript_35837/g.55132  ORF Transcript_35837/g.55132 Transcript_35837/m.55132 type:complete len:146 (-) Transcript_35837:62-499(-)